MKNGPDDRVFGDYCDEPAPSFLTQGSLQYLQLEHPFEQFRPGVAPELFPGPWDAFTNMVIDMVNTPVFSNFMGTLDASGSGAAQLNTLGSLSPRLVCVEMCFACILSSPYDFASNAVKVIIAN